VAMIFSFILSFLGYLHPVHLSVTEITYSEKDKALQMTSRIFIDDLELSIRRDVKDEELDLLKPGNGKTTDQLVSAYLAKHLKVKVDGKLVPQKYLGSEIEDVAIICYIEMPNIKKLKTVETMNDVIQETHADQSNLVHVTYKGKLKSLRLTMEKPSDILTFEPK
jgi:hypothetical protein